jgi:hypothetical protein
LIVIVPAALQLQLGDVRNLAAHGVGSTLTAGGRVRDVGAVGMAWVPPRTQSKPSLAALVEVQLAPHDVLFWLLVTSH